MSSTSNTQNNQSEENEFDFDKTFEEFGQSFTATPGAQTPMLQTPMTFSPAPNLGDFGGFGLGGFGMNMNVLGKKGGFDMNMGNEGGDDNESNEIEISNDSSSDLSTQKSNLQTEIQPQPQSQPSSSTTALATANPKNPEEDEDDDSPIIVDGIELKIQNVVATTNLCKELILNKIADQARNAEYNPKRFAACILRLTTPRATGLIFKTGKIVVTGAKSSKEAKFAAKKFGKIVVKCGFSGARFKDFKIQNIVASANIKFPINLTALNSEHVEFSHYEPEIFPGLVYRLSDPSVVFLLFVSGKIVLTGAKSKKQIADAFKKIFPVLQNHASGRPSV